MSPFRAILVLALVLHPVLLLRTAPVVAALFPAHPAPCCPTDCACGESCGCAVEAPTNPGPPAPQPPSTAPTSNDLRAQLPARPLLVTLTPDPPPSLPSFATRHHQLPHTSCASLNALLCIWTT